MKINKDTIVSIFLLIFCGIMINSSYYIEDPGYQGMKASYWPRIILWLLSIMSLVMLVKSFANKVDSINAGLFSQINFMQFKNALICFGMFIFFLTFLDLLLTHITLSHSYCTIFNGNLEMNCVQDLES